MIASELQRLIEETFSYSNTRPSGTGGRGSGLTAHPDLTIAEFDPGPSLLRLASKVYVPGDAAQLAGRVRRIGALCGRFRKLYGDGPVRVLRVPARINILGEHVDYVSYIPTASLPFGSREHDMLMAYRAAQDGSVRGASTLEEYEPFSFSLAESGLPPGAGAEGWPSYLQQVKQPAPHWSNYVKGAAYFAAAKYGGRLRRGCEFVVDSGIPPSGGASSSSALIVLAGAAIREANGLAYGAEELALDSSQAEWFVGTRGGAMDHLTICLARDGHAVHIPYLGPRVSVVPVPHSARFRWVTFFSHPADKGREVMLGYNERAVVSRLLIPAIIEGWKSEAPSLDDAWVRAVEAFGEDPCGAHGLEGFLERLPESLMLAEVETSYPEAYRRCLLDFPALVHERRDEPLRVRPLALHHAGEARRVAAAVKLLEGAAGGGAGEADSLMHAVGALLDESHRSLRDNYGVSTPEVEALVETVRSDAGVYGARLMGGGFGGNVLALTAAGNVSALVERVQSGYYAPRGREAAREGSVMISTPGEGLAHLDPERAWREGVEEFNMLPAASDEERRRCGELLARAAGTVNPLEVWPVVVAAGKGARAQASGLDVPKPLAEVCGVPSIVRVLRNVRAGLGATRTPVVIVSPETEGPVRAALEGEDVHFVTQAEALGTGDAVLRARELMKDFDGRALVVWGTQPVIRPETYRRAAALAALFGEYAMVFPTALKESPYAPVARDEGGRITGARETHLEGAERPPLGETNVGLFMLKSEEMFEALAELRRLHWREGERRYERAGGELGFPNEMVKHFAGRPAGVFACAFADPREEQGIKTLADVARCEQFIREFECEEKGLEA
ncbi:MAG: NTP transferase domain-containing protein [Acidobacteria bacterium]|nr:NTP transferase domain-containing protein [Acidobacteriota bacterium]